jgi:glycerol uptake facilitator-like aquaporin
VAPYIVAQLLGSVLGVVAARWVWGPVVAEWPVVYAVLRPGPGWSTWELFATEALRNATVRKFGVADLTTTVLTMTMTGLAAESSFGGGSNPRWQRRVLSVLFMFLGAATAALLLRRSLALPLGVATMSAVCGAAVFYGNRNTRRARHIYFH